MNDRKMIKGLVHKFAWARDYAKFFEEIDRLGGWPVGFQYVGFEHTDERAAGFTNSTTNTGWWTVLSSANDYYLWKLSPEYLQRIVDAAIHAARVTSVDASKLWIKADIGGSRAVRRVPA